MRCWRKSSSVTKAVVNARADPLEAALQRLIEEGRLLRIAQVGVVVVQLVGQPVDRAVGQVTHRQLTVRLLLHDLQGGGQHRIGRLLPVQRLAGFEDAMKTLGVKP